MNQLSTFSPLGQEPHNGGPIPQSHGAFVLGWSLWGGGLKFWECWWLSYGLYTLPCEAHTGTSSHITAVFPASIRLCQWEALEGGGRRVEELDLPVGSPFAQCLPNIIPAPAIPLRRSSRIQFAIFPILTKPASSHRLRDLPQLSWAFFSEA